MSALVIGHGNVHSTNRNTRAMLDVIRSSGADSFGLNEAQHVLPALRRRLRRSHRVTVSPAPGRARETPILTRASMWPLGHGSAQVCRPADPPKWAPARWITWDSYDHPIGKVAHINVHLNAQIGQQHPDDLPRVAAYVASLEALDQVMRMLERTGHLVIVSGDINMTPSIEARVPANRRPRRLLRLHDLSVAGRGVDVIAVPRTLRTVVRVIPGVDVGSDHPWLVAKVTRR